MCLTHSSIIRQEREGGRERGEKNKGRREERKEGKKEKGTEGRKEETTTQRELVPENGWKMKFEGIP